MLGIGTTFSALKARVRGPLQPGACRRGLKGELVSATDLFVVDRFGRPDSLQPERAFTWNAGAVLFLEGGVEAAVDHWRYDFEDVVGSLPHDAIASLYAGDDPLARAAASPFIICPRRARLGPAADDRCSVQDLQRIQVDLVNWPGLTTSGIHTHFAARTQTGPGQLSAGWDSTHTVGYDTKELLLGSTSYILNPAGRHPGYLNFAHPIAVLLPRWKSRWSASYAWNVYTLASYLSTISVYEDRRGRTPSRRSSTRSSPGM